MEQKHKHAKAEKSVMLGSKSKSANCVFRFYNFVSNPVKKYLPVIVKTESTSWVHGLTSCKWAWLRPGVGETLLYQWSNYFLCVTFGVLVLITEGLT